MMRRRFVSSLFAISLLAAIALAAVVTALFFHSNVVDIDNVAWRGDSVAPCFQNAALCHGHQLGLDENGRDVLARVLLGSGIVLEVAAANTLVALLIGAAFGFAHRLRRGGIVAAAASGALTSFVVWPLIVVATSTAFMRQSADYRLILLCAYGIFFCKPIAEAFATFQLRVLLSACATVARNVIFADALVNFLGFGVQPPRPSLGNMLANAESNMQVAWWAFAFPLAMLMLIVGLLQVIEWTGYVREAADA